ncbi:MAG: AI-2E family transporter [Rickettsiales bacterium]|nr:MAG: AI-2E family transporter [Rickettsiales bacterium]
MNKVIFWCASLLLIGGLMYVLSSTIAPFLVALMFAYLLQPSIETNCKRFNLGRPIVTFGVFILFLSSFVTVIVLVVPIIFKQFAMFLGKIPQYKDNFEASVTSWSARLNDIDPELADKVSDSLQSFINTAFSMFASLANHLWHYTLATINFFTFVALMPIILYYFLRDWPKIIKAIESMLPKHGKSKIREIFTSINQLLSAYIRGQLNICLMLALYYIIGLEIIGVDFALLLGVLSGFLIIIPFIGALVSFLLVMVSCYFSFGYGVELLYVTLLFFIGHSVEGYVLAPKIIGDRIGLHPVWIIFAVFACGSLFGILGVMFAIPIAGIVKVFLSHLIGYYKSTQIYKN